MDQPQDVLLKSSDNKTNGATNAAILLAIAMLILLALCFTCLGGYLVVRIGGSLWQQYRLGGTLAGLTGTSPASLTETAAAINASSITSPTPGTPQPPPIAGVACISSNEAPENARVVRVIDGDTIEVELEGELVSLRYIGIDAPEVEGADIELGRLSAQANSDLAADQEVRLYRDVSETDSFGRLLRYVVTGDKFINYELVKNGFAVAKDYPPDLACSGTFYTAQTAAMNNQAGLWAQGFSDPQRSLPIFTPGASENPPAAIAPTRVGNCDPAYPTVCIPSPPPNLTCEEIPFRNFQVLPPDPHGFDRNRDGVGCEE